MSLILLRLLIDRVKKKSKTIDFELNGVHEIDAILAYVPFSSPCSWFISILWVGIVTRKPNLRLVCAWPWVQAVRTTPSNKASGGENHKLRQKFKGLLSIRKNRIQYFLSFFSFMTEPKIDNMSIFLLINVPLFTT